MSDPILFLNEEKCVYMAYLSTYTRSAARVPTHLKLDVMDLRNRSRIEPGHASSDDQMEIAAPESSLLGYTGIQPIYTYIYKHTLTQQHEK